jgi:hypothetical protein
MPKPTKRSFYIVDLVRDRKLFANLDIPPIRVNITIEVDADVPSAKMDRLEKAARAKLDEYETIITKEAEKFNKQIEVLLAQGKLQDAIKLADGANSSIKQALNSAQGAAQAEVEKVKKQEAGNDKLLKEARIKVVVTFVIGAIKVSANVARIGASHGGDVHAWLSLAKELYKLGMLIKQQLKDEEQLQADMLKAIGAFLEFRSTAVSSFATKNKLNGTLPEFPDSIMFVANGVLETAKDTFKGKDAQTVAKDVFNFVVKGVQQPADKVEKARKAYRDHTTKMRQHVDAISGKADKLFAEMKKATNLKEGVKIGAECMQLKAKVTRLAKELEAAVAFLNAAQTTMSQFGLKYNDKTLMEKLAAFDLKTIIAEGNTIMEGVKAIKELADAVS